MVGKNEIKNPESKLRILPFVVLLAITTVFFSCEDRPNNSKSDLNVSLSNPEEITSEESIPLPFYNTPEFSPEWIKKSDPKYDSIHRVGFFSLQNQHGRFISNQSVRGKIVVANFFFTICPGICPKMMGNMQILQETYNGDDGVAFLSHSVTPWMDSVSVMKAYAERNGITAPNWHLLTGTKKEIYTLARGSYFADEGFGKSVTLENDFLHTENVVLLDKKMRIRGVYSGTLPLQMRRLIEDIELLKQE